MTTEVNNNNKKNDRLWFRIALIAGIFAVLTGVLLIANYLQYKKTDPVNMTVITSLVERLYTNPADSALREEIRELDLLSRKAYFTSQWQIRTGGYLLLASVALMIISLQIVEYRKKINPEITAGIVDESMQQRTKAQKWIVIGGGAFLLTAVLFAFMASNDLKEKFTALGEGKEIVPEETSSPDLSLTADYSVGIIADTTSITDPASAPTATVSSDNFTNFRGTAGVSSKRNIPVSWDGSTGSNIKWKTKIPLPGNNSPIVWGDRVFVTVVPRNSQACMLGGQRATGGQRQGRDSLTMPTRVASCISRRRSPSSAPISDPSS